MLKPGIEISIEAPEVLLHHDKGGGLEAHIAFRQSGEVVERVYFRISQSSPVAPPVVADVALPLAVPLAMRLRCSLRFAEPVSRRLLEGARKFQEIFSVWYPDFQPVPIHAPAAEGDTPVRDSRGVGVFFSGGLDSSYSLLKHCEEVTHAIFIHGCDIKLENTAYRDRAVRRLRETAESCGAELVEVETDLLRCSDEICEWGKHYHGSAMVAIAMLLSGTLRKVYLASSTSYLRIVPWGSSAVTDPLWTTPYLEVVHDGAEAERLEKARRIVESPEALRNLRVCFETPDGGYNCGRCEKCYRTMVALRICGALDDCAAFDRPLDLDAMVEHPEVIEKFGRLRSWITSGQCARDAGVDRELVAALEELSRRSSSRDLVRKLATDKHDIVASPHWRTSLPKFRGALFNSLRNEDPEWFTAKVMKWLPAERDEAFTRLAEYDRPWFKRRYWRYRWSRLLKKLRPSRGA